MNRAATPTWHHVETVLAALTSRELTLLELVARLPFVSAPQLAPIAGGSRSTVYGRLARLTRMGAVASVPGPCSKPGRPVRLLHLTDLGAALLLRLGAVKPDYLARQLIPERVERRGLEPLLGCYELLACIAASRDGGIRLLAWQRPWRRRYQLGAGRPVQEVRLPAFAAVRWGAEEHGVRGAYLLLPDGADQSITAWRGRLQRLAQVGQVVAEPLPALVIATTSPARVSAWERLLHEVGGGRSLIAQVTTVADLAERQAVVASPVPATWPPHDAARRCTSAPCPPHRAIPRLIERRLHTIGSNACRLRPGDRLVLDLIGRHAFVRTTTLATLLGRPVAWVRVRTTRLRQEGLLAVADAEEGSSHAGRRVLELTALGLRVLAAQLGLPLATAVRQHGLAGGGATSPIGPRAALMAHLGHTLGTDAVFAGLTAAARVDPRGGQLVEWRNALACTRGRLRPDGYGLLRLRGRDYGFFLEFDRGTMRPRELRAKFFAYHRYRASTRAARDFDRFPTVLVVTVGPGAEDRLADAITAADSGAATPLPALLTTTAWIEAHPAGALGPVWRQPRSTTRCRWPRADGGHWKGEVHRAG